MALPGDGDGLRTELLEEGILENRPALIYVVPDFQNPRGTTLAPHRRKELAEVAQRHGIPVLEDDPYGALRFRGTAAAPIAALTEGLTFHLGTFSKTLAPGLRLGWVHGPRQLMRAMTVAKQACDLHTATLTQHAVVELLQTFDYEAHLEVIRAEYRRRCEAMLRALERTMPPGHALVYSRRWPLPLARAAAGAARRRGVRSGHRARRGGGARQRVLRRPTPARLPPAELLQPERGEHRNRHGPPGADPLRPPASVPLRRGRLPASVGVAGEEASERRAEQDLEVQEQGPVLDVIEVVLDALLDGGLAAQAVDLRPAGDARLHLVPQVVAWGSAA